MFDAAETSVWWASREMQPSKTLGDYVGKNEKTKVIVKLQKRGQGAPVREPPLDEKAQRVILESIYCTLNNHITGNDCILLQEARRAQEIDGGS